MAKIDLKIVIKNLVSFAHERGAKMYEIEQAAGCSRTWLYKILRRQGTKHPDSDAKSVNTLSPRQRDM